MVGEVKMVDVIGVRVACRRMRSGGDERDEIEVGPRCSGLADYVSNICF